jgi:hypothetical protein
MLFSIFLEKVRIFSGYKRDYSNAFNGMKSHLFPKKARILFFSIKWIEFRTYKNSSKNTWNGTNTYPNKE